MCAKLSGRKSIRVVLLTHLHEIYILQISYVKVLIDYRSSFLICKSVCYMAHTRCSWKKTFIIWIFVQKVLLEFFFSKIYMRKLWDCQEHICKVSQRALAILRRRCKWTVNKIEEKLLITFFFWLSEKTLTFATCIETKSFNSLLSIYNCKNRYRIKTFKYG